MRCLPRDVLHQAGGGGRLREPLGKVLVEGGEVAGLQVAAHAVHGGLQPGGGEGFEEVIEGVDFKGGDGMLVVSGDEDDGGQAGRGQGAQDIEAADLGHLDVQKHEVGAAGADEVDGVGTVGAFAGNLDIGFGREHFPEAGAGEEFEFVP